MALTQSAASVTVTVKDNNGKTSTVSVYYPATTAAGTVVGQVDDLAALIAGITNGVIVAATASFGYYETEPATPASESEVERKLVLVGRAANGGTVRISVPSPSFALEQTGTDSVDLADPLVEPLVTFLTTNASSSTGSDITAITDGFFSHRYRPRKR